MGDDPLELGLVLSLRLLAYVTADAPITAPVAKTMVCKIVEPDMILVLWRPRSKSEKETRLQTPRSRFLIPSLLAVGFATLHGGNPRCY